MNALNSIKSLKFNQTSHKNIPKYLPNTNSIKRLEKTAPKIE